MVKQRDNYKDLKKKEERKKKIDYENVAGWEEEKKKERQFLGSKSVRLTHQSFKQSLFAESPSLFQLL